MEEILKLDPIKKVGGSVDLPGSKSISNRALLLAALSEGTTELQNLLAAEDTEMMIGALEALGVKLEVSDIIYVVFGFILFKAVVLIVKVTTSQTNIFTCLLYTSPSPRDRG